jgi:mannose-6-phosphate isomerase-like protein (cupin superfamily)
MPLLKISENKFPDWSEVKKITQLSIEPNSTTEIIKSFQKYALFIISGECSIKVNGYEKMFLENDSLFSDKKNILIKSANQKTEIVIVEGDWSDEIGGSAVFKMSKNSMPRNIGDPVDYPRTNDFDNHYHDFDEYWIILKGSGLAVSEGVKFKFVAGDIIATRVGDHHDLPKVYEEILGIYFETSLKGQKRIGHLWNHTHGVPDYSVREAII